VPGGRELGLARRAYGEGRIREALEHFQAAAEQGNAAAQYYTGVMYADGQGTKRDYVAAAKWYEKGAAQNHPDALVALARLYVFGTGVDVDAATAVDLYERAARAYPPGDDRDHAIEQKNALAAVLDESRKSAEESGSSSTN
jgi:TPR repeat protein